MASCILPDQFCGKMQENGFAKMEKNFEIGLINRK